MTKNPNGSAQPASWLNISCSARFSPIALTVFLVTLAVPSATAQIAVRGETIYTMAGAPLKNGVILIRAGKIERIGPASEVTIPDEYRTLMAKVVTPGLIDAHTVVGLSGYENQRHDQDQLERSGPVQPELRAIDGYNAREKLVSWVRSYGVTTIHTGHGPGALVSGQTMIVKTRGATVEEAVMVPEAMVAVTLGQSGLATESGKSPGTRPKAVAMLRSELSKAQEYAQKLKGAADKRPERDLRTESLLPVIRRERPLLVTAHRADDILAALRIAKEFDIRLVLDGAAEAYLVIEQIKAAKVPVIIHATMYRSHSETENLSFETASILRKAGIPIALQSGYEGYVPKTRVVLFEAAIAAANGLSVEEALATITIDAAKLLGVEKQVGSLEKGKDADIVLFDGDPFEYISHVTTVLIDGKIVSDEVR